MIKLKMILEKIVDSIGAEPFNLDKRGYIRMWLYSAHLIVIHYGGVLYYKYQ